jgi:hypothetical protein
VQGEKGHKNAQESQDILFYVRFGLFRGKKYGICLQFEVMFV